MNVMAELPTRHMCLDILELQMVETDPQTGNLRFQTSEHGINLVIDYMTVSGWLQGYFTATNIYYANAHGDLTKRTKPRAWMVWLFSYCQSHPTSGLLEAANVLTDAFEHP